MLARFRYNDLKEAARAADAGPMQIQWWEAVSSSCAEAVPQSATRSRINPKRVVEELEKEVRSEARHRSRERVEKHCRIGESRFMPQP